MLEARNLVKIYKPKKGVPVTALNDVSLKFPETGMVFLLGKSGSGKSTLLNLLGGLDKYDKGEIFIKGVSSKDFKQKHFDSYRNTYVGFIFQDYNILDEFTVGANIALAIELQNRKATDDEINAILKEVDLEGYGSRKPNELSGGQKQRVAIARALVKKPQIIMADEPTGALDSNTGKQIFDTLKKLSRKRLVIVVSHDREFAEGYADRIIELSDGNVISDVEYDADFKANDNELLYNNNEIIIPNEYHLTEQDIIAINNYIDSLNHNAEKKLIINQKTNNIRFKDTDQSKIIMPISSNFNLIKSKLPLKNAFKIGGSSLKHKKFRLVITILLSCIAFGLFGLADTFSAYNHIETCTNSLIDSNVKYISIGKAQKMGTGKHAYWRDYGIRLSSNEISRIKNKTNISLHGVYSPFNSDLNFSSNIDNEVKLSETNYNIYSTYFYGFATVNQKIIKEMGFKLLAGALPEGDKDQIAISEYIFETFKKAKYTDGKLVKDASGKESLVYTEINTYDDILGKFIKLNGKDYLITAVVDTNFELDRYNELIVKKENLTRADELLQSVLFSEFNFAKEYSYSSVIMTGDGFIERLIAEQPKISNISKGYLSFHSGSYAVDSNYIARLSDITDEKIIWVDGQKASLADKEIVITLDTFHNYEIQSYDKKPTVSRDDYETEEEYLKAYFKKAGELSAGKQLFSDDLDYYSEEGYRVVGYIMNDEKSKLSSTVICSDKLYNEFAEGPEYRYSFAVGNIPTEKEDLRSLVSYCYDESGSIRFPIQNSVTFELDSVNGILKELSDVFLYIGLGFALFAAVMLANFIATSISYKKQEIGILRAIGSRSNDVFRIFFAESFIIAIINFILSAMGVFVATTVINYVIRNNLGILVTVLTFNLRQIILLLLVSVLVAFIASYLPVKRIASKRPIDAIRGR